MFIWGIGRCVLAGGLALVLAGCATSQRLNGTLVTGWESEEFAGKTSQVPASLLAKPPSNRMIQTNVALPPVVVVPATPTPITPAPTSAPDLHETWVPMVRWCRDHDVTLSRRASNSSQPAFVLGNSNGVLVFRPGSQVVTWQGVELRLGFAPQISAGQPLIHALDIQKTFLPLLQNDLVVATANRVIVIDPGHGGEDSGTRCVVGGAHEKDFTLDWARRLAALLQTKGWTIFLTRTNDSDLSLSNRVSVAEQHHAELFISLHFNSSAPDEGQRGLETYCLTPAGMPSTVTRGFSDETALVFPNNTFDEQNLALAVGVHRALLQVNGGHDRGVRRARFLGVLRNQHRPAILVEGGYLSNPGEARLIATPAYRQKLAEAVVQSLGVRNGNLAQARSPGVQASQEGIKSNSVVEP